MIHSKTEKALVTLGTLAVFLYVEIKSGSFGNSVFDQIQNHILSGISSITEQIEDTVEVILTVASSFFLLTVASPIRIFLPRYLELGTCTPYHEIENLVDFSRLGKSPIRSKMVIFGSLPVKLPVKMSFPEVFIEPKVSFEISGGILGDSFFIR